MLNFSAICQHYPKRIQAFRENILKDKTGISDKTGLIRALKTKADTVNLKALSDDVEPFLMESSQKDRVLLFKPWLDSL
jgi:hypothetical protein